MAAEWMPMRVRHQWPVARWRTGGPQQASWRALKHECCPSWAVVGVDGAAFGPGSDAGLLEVVAWQVRRFHIVDAVRQWLPIMLTSLIAWPQIYVEPV